MKRAVLTSQINTCVHGFEWHEMLSMQRLPQILKAMNNERECGKKQLRVLICLERRAYEQASTEPISSHLLVPTARSKLAVVAGHAHISDLIAVTGVLLHKHATQRIPQADASVLWLRVCDHTVMRTHTLIWRQSMGNAD